MDTNISNVPTEMITDEIARRAELQRDRDLTTDLLAVAREANMLLADGGGSAEDRAVFYERKRAVLARMDAHVGGDES